MDTVLILNSSVSMGIFCQYSQDDNVLSVSSGCNDLHLAQISAGHAKKAPPATQSLGLSEECMYLSQCSSGKKKKLKWRSKTNLLFYICIIPDQYNSNKKKLAKLQTLFSYWKNSGFWKVLSSRAVLSAKALLFTWPVAGTKQDVPPTQRPDLENWAQQWDCETSHY